MSTPIKREDIRKGDKILATFTEEFIAKSDGIDHETGFTYELIERPVVLPTVPGIYSDRSGKPWDRTMGMDKYPLLAEYAPFTLLRPVAEVAAEVLEDLESEMTARFGWTFFEPSGKTGDSFAAVAAKWAAK